MDFQFEEGETLLINKAEGWTSFDVVKKIRILLRYHRGINKIKVGHAGTLDPLATGLLICCTGKATKKISLLQDMEKTYLATVMLGKTTPSFDLETEVDQTFTFDHVDKKLLQDVLSEFTGEQDQIPPDYSAKNVKGMRAYKLARNGKPVELKPQRIVIREIEIKDITLPVFTIKVICSKGTYIRSLVRDIGNRLQCGAVLQSLTRTMIGEYSLKEAISIENLEKILSETEQF